MCVWVKSGTTSPPLSFCPTRSECCNKLTLNPIIHVFCPLPAQPLFNGPSTDSMCFTNEPKQTHNSSKWCTSLCVWGQSTHLHCSCTAHHCSSLLSQMSQNKPSKWAIHHLISHCSHHCSYYQCLCCHRWNLRFLRSDFRGQLPCHYSPHDNSTSVVPDHMNDLNREEPSRYVSVCNDSCFGPVAMLCVMSLFCWRVFPWMIMYI